MRRTTYIFLLLFLSIPLFSQRRTNINELEKIKDVLYTKKNKTPFTGIVLEKWEVGYSETEVKKGLKDGAFNQYHTNGKLLSSYRYKNNKLNGISFHLQENGDTLFIVNQFINDIVVGSIRSYYPNGNISEILNIEALDKKYLIQDDNGRFGSPKLFRRLKITGNIECYYDNGQLECKIYYSEGLLNGEFVIYYRNGNMKAKAMYIKGKPINTISIYYEDETLKEVLIYDDEGVLVNRKIF